MGYIKIFEERIITDAKGFAINGKLHAIIQGKLETLKAWDLKKGDTLPGKIIIKESLNPFNNANPDRDLTFHAKSPCTL